MAEPWTDNEVVTPTQLAGLPWGVMGYVAGSTSDQSGIGSTMTNVTGLTVTFTAVASRLYRAEVNLCALQVTSGGTAKVQISDGAGVAAVLRDITLATNDEGTFTAVVLETFGGGSITRKVMASTSAGTLTILGTSTRLAYFSVTDIGPG